MITAVRWGLLRGTTRARRRCRLESVHDSGAVAGALRADAPSLEMLEVTTEAGIRRTLAYLSVAAPVPMGPRVDARRVRAGADPHDELLEALGGGITDSAIVAVDATGRERLLRIREAHPEAVNHDGVSQRLDVGVPLDVLGPDPDDRVGRRRRPGARR